MGGQFVEYGVAKRWWGTVLDKEKKPHQIELDLVAESLDKKKILIGECKWTSGEDAVALENELRWKASMLPFAKGKEVVPVIFAKNITNKSESSLTITPEDVMELMKQVSNLLLHRYLEIQNLWVQQNLPSKNGKH